MVRHNLSFFYKRNDGVFMITFERFMQSFTYYKTYNGPWQSPYFLMYGCCLRNYSSLSLTSVKNTEIGFHTNIDFRLHAYT